SLLLCGAHPPLHSFPTRRSSDLGCSGGTAGPTATPKIELSNLRAKTFGLESVLCGRPGLVTYRSIDELTVDFHASGATVEGATRSEEHTSELQSLRHLVCRLLLE